MRSLPTARPRRHVGMQDHELAQRALRIEMEDLGTEMKRALAREVSEVRLGPRRCV